MKPLLMTLLVVLSAGAAAAPTPSTAGADERDEFRQTYQLMPGAFVRIAGINGSVTVETADVSTAEVHIERTARTREDLAYRKITVEASPDQLIIRGEKDSDDSWGERRGQSVRQRVSLKLPRRVDVAVHGVNGPVSVAEIAGRAEVTGVNSSVNFARAAAFSRISGINGKVTVGMVRVGEGGLSISGINGGVECRIGESVNADLKTSNVNGSVHVELARVTLSGEVSRSRVNAKIGEGGPPITVSGVNGTIRFTLLN